LGLESARRNIYSVIQIGVAISYPLGRSGRRDGGETHVVEPELLTVLLVRPGFLLALLFAGARGGGGLETRTSWEGSVGFLAMQG
jgi:hypothetical protein